MNLVQPGDDLAAALARGGVVRLAEGRHGALRIEQAAVVEGVAGSVVDAGGRGPAVHVGASKGTVVLRGLRFTGGHGELGAGARIDGTADTVFEDCVFDGSKARERGARGAGVAAGSVRFARCRFAEDVLFTGASEVVLEECTVAGDVRAREGAQLRLVGGSVGGKLDVAGSTTRAPYVHVDGTSIAGGVANDEDVPGEVVVA